MDVNAFRAACKGLNNAAQRSQAERFLLEFRATASPSDAQHILQHSDDDAVRFQALLALRDMVLLRWSALGRDSQQAVLQFFLQLALVQLKGDQQPLLRSQATGAAAAIIKRGWDDSTPAEREGVLHQVHALAMQQGSLEARRASLDLMAALVQEFSPVTASTMGLSWEIHERCRASFEAAYLHGTLLHALASAREAAPTAAAGADGGVCLSALHLLSAVFSWTFSKAGGSGIWRTLESGRPAAESGSLRPPAAWRDSLLAPDALEWLGALAQVACQPQTLGTPLAAAVRSVVVQLCGLTGDDVLGPPDAAGARAELGLAPQASLRNTHVQCMLRVLLPWVMPPQDAIALARHAGEQQFLDGCQGLLLLASTHRAPAFEAAGPALLGTSAGGGGRGMLALLAELTSAVVAASGPRDAAQQQGWEAEAADVLLEAWVELVSDHRGGVASEGAALAAGSVFGCIVEVALERAAAEALEDEDETEGGEQLQTEEWLSRVAMLGRAAAAYVMPQLADKLRACLSSLQHSVQSGADPSVALEQLCMLTQLGGYVLADNFEGETPLVPLLVAHACEVAGHAGAADPAARLGQELLTLGNHCLTQAGQVGASPRLVEVSSAMLARWACTYLMSSDPASPALSASYGPGSSGGCDATKLCVSLVLVALTRYPGEKALHEAACTRLLAALVRRRETCVALQDSPAWLALCDAVGRGEGLQALSEKVQRRLLQSLVLAAAGWPTSAAGWAGQVLENTVQQLRQLGSSKEAASAALQRADGLHLCVALVERLRGAVRGTLPCTQPAIFVQVTTAAPALATLLSASKAQPLAACLILKLGGEVVEYHGAYLSPTDATALCSWVLQLLQIYSANNLGQISVSAGKALAAETLADRCQDLRALLKLLSRLTQTDWGQLAGDSGAEQAVDVAQVVFAGLDIVVPLMDLELLKFPKLCRAYFALLAHVLEVYPERMAALPARPFQTLLSTLLFGVGVTADEEVTQAVFEAVAALARFHVQSTRGGGLGMGANNTPGADGMTPLGALLHATLTRLINDSGLEAVDHASEAVLPLALADTAALQRCGETMISSCVHFSGKGAALKAFSSLVAQVGASIVMDRPARKEFGSVLHKFVVELRGAVRLR